MPANRWMPCSVLLGALLLGPAAWAADIELTAPDGRRVILKDDGTWRYADAPAGAETGQATDKKAEGEAVLSLEGRIEGNRICRLQLRMVNNLPYEVRSLVPEFAIYRPNGVMYDAQLSGFSFIKPGDSQRREVRFNGIDCKEIARVQVGGADRCEMGDLDKFTPGRGMCIARVRVVASDLMPFEKAAPEPPKPAPKDAAKEPAADGAPAKDDKAASPGADKPGAAGARKPAAPKTP